MPLQKQPIAINFAQGLDLKTDPKQVSIGRFLELENSIFTKAGLLQKRNGFVALTPLSDSSSSFLTTFNGNLTAIGSSLNALAEGANMWTNRGSIQPLSLSVLSLIRSNTGQNLPDIALASNGLACVTYLDSTPSGIVHSYSILDSTTGQTVISPKTINIGTSTNHDAPKIVLIGAFFVIVYTAVFGGTNQLRYIAVNTTNPSVVLGPTVISSTYTPEPTGAFDVLVADSTLYVAWNGSDLGGDIQVATINASLVGIASVKYSGESAKLLSLGYDGTYVFLSYFDVANACKVLTVKTPQLNAVLAPTAATTTGVVTNITSLAADGVCTVYYQVLDTYSIIGSRTDIIKSFTMTRQGVSTAEKIVIRSIGLASKAFSMSGNSYFLGIYGSTFQPTYFLMSTAGVPIAKLAYQNAGDYYVGGLPSVTISGTKVQIPYLFKDLIQSTSKAQGASVAAGIYSQTGINLVTFDFATSSTVSTEIAKSLHLTGGFLWQYDGFSPVEHGFFLWPDYTHAAQSQDTDGHMTAQQYFYVATYEWTDSQGMIHKSAPSIPQSMLVTAPNNQVTVTVPTLRLTYKTANPVKIVIYRWSTFTQTYYQVTSIASPLLNTTAADTVDFLDTAGDAAIIGNNILYTTGSVIENIGAPACDTVTLFQQRLFLLDAEDKNLLWYSKQIIEATPVELSDLFTVFVAPTVSVQGSTGDVTALAPLDDKLIVFKKDAIYYITGLGPDNTGSNGAFSDPVFITATVGCANQKSIVFTPNGLMFQSDKGIWLLGRDLSTQYLGAPVEDFNSSAVVSAVSIPGTNQIRLTLDSGVTLMYDYYFNQWGTFTNIPSISSTLYQGLHTYLDKYGRVFQETPGKYLDDSRPVLMHLKTGWINLAGLQGFERFYQMFLLGEYLSPFKLNAELSYDYNPNPSQNVIVTPDNFSPAYGNDPLYASGTPYGGPASAFEARVFPQQQKCETFQLALTEVYDPTFGVTAGAGLTLSGLSLIVGAKKGYRTSSSSRSFG